jgi:two-component system, cell cycle sensor histidine kinase and response regulator CckA
MNPTFHPKEGNILQTGNDRVLIIDDDPEIQNAYRLVLAPEPEDRNASRTKLAHLLPRERAPELPVSPQFELDFASQGPDGVALAAAAFENEQPFAVAFIDIRMPPGFDGMETAARIRRIDPNIEIVVVTAFSDRSRDEIVRAVGYPEKLLFLRKPFDPEELLQMALSLTAKWNLARQAEVHKAALAESEARFRALVENTSDWVWETDTDGRFTYCSPLCETIYGYQPRELVGQPLFQRLMHPEEIADGRALFQQCVEAMEGFHNIERRSLTKDGRVIHIEFSGMPVIAEDGRVTGFRGIDRDITRRKIVEKERRELEAQYRQSQKLEALGTLAGGIAHDLNNVLTPIMGGAQLSLLKLDPSHPIYDNLKTIETGVQKAAELIHQILAFSRKQVMTTQPLNLSNLIKDFSVMLRRLIREDIHLTFDLNGKLGIIEADKNQMEQILINLVVNAMDAVAEGGQISIQTANQTVSKPTPLTTGSRLLPGRHVVLSVIDNGMGMNPATIGRIFDPFFTTKENGRGTGLGLSTVYGIVKQHGGEIQVESSPGKGTRFDIFFRCTESSVFAGETDAPQAVEGGRETILLVEDNADVRDVARTSLKHYGYRVIEAANGTEAIQVFKELDGRIDLLFTDVVMPAMGGQSLSESLRILKPGLPVLFMSGHPFEVNTKKLAAAAGNDFIQKPFKPLDLAQKIRRMLDKANQSN